MAVGGARDTLSGPNQKKQTSAKKKSPKCNHANGTLREEVRMKSRVSGELMEKKEDNRRVGVAGGLTMRKAEYTTLLAVGMTWPPPRCSGS